MKIGGLTDVIRACTSSVDYNIDANTSDIEKAEKATPENELFEKNTDQYDASPGSSTRRNKRRRSLNRNSERASNSTLQPTLEVLLPHAEVKEELMDDDNSWDNSYPPEENDNYSTKYEEEYEEQSQSDNEMHSDAASSSQVWGPVFFFVAGIIFIMNVGSCLNMISDEVSGPNLAILKISQKINKKKTTIFFITC